MHIKLRKDVRLVFKLDYSSGKPIYEQIKMNLKQLIIDGALKSGDRIPSVRELACSMAINPNTIQKAYKELEGEGYVYSVRAKGVFVAEMENINEDIDSDELFLKLEQVVKEMYFLGVKKEKITLSIDKIYEGNDEND